MKKFPALGAPTVQGTLECSKENSELNSNGSNCLDVQKWGGRAGVCAELVSEVGVGHIIKIMLT